MQLRPSKLEIHPALESCSFEKILPIVIRPASYWDPDSLHSNK